MRGFNEWIYLTRKLNSLSQTGGLADLDAGAEKVAEAVSSAAATANLPSWVQNIIDAVISGGLRLVNAALVGIIGWYVIKLITRWIRALLNRTALEESIRSFLLSIFRTVLKAFLVIMIIGILGIPMSSIVAVVGSAGLAIGLALQGCLTNFAGGVLILVLKPFKSGDYIVVDTNIEGTVTEIDIIYTKLLTPDNRAVTIPNGTLANSTVINTTKEKYRRLDFPVAIGYEEDIDKVKSVLYEMAMTCADLEKDRECIVFVNSFDPSSISLTLRFWVQSDKYWSVKFEIQEKIKKTLDEHQITIPFDQLDVHVMSENRQ